MIYNSATAIYFTNIIILYTAGLLLLVFSTDQSDWKSHGFHGNETTSVLLEVV